MSAPVLDEMLDDAGRLRPAWRATMDALLALGDGVLAERARRLDRALAEDGLTSLLPGSHATEWACDPIPLPFDADAFDALAAAAIQRAELLDAVLADVYGPMATLREGLLPPSLLYPNPNFLRACCRDGESTRRGDVFRFLTTYAVDLIRGADGRFRVVADRCSEMEGACYALENRRAMRRVLPELFTDGQATPLDGFFADWRRGLAAVASSRAQPGLALLTPGPLDPHWFDHVLAASELRCALVQAADLTLRGGSLHLRTLRGLRRVDVLLRRQDGVTLDPLDVADVRGGVGGLLAAHAAGNVRVVNDPGSGFASSPGLAAFLPALSVRLLGAELALPSVNMLWLGDDRARAAFHASPVDWTVGSSLTGEATPVEIAGLSPRARGRLFEAIEENPAAYLATARHAPSRVPCVGADGLERRRLLLRLFLVHDGAAWRVMPGGLARALDDDEPLGGPLPSRGRLKDVIVARPGPTGIGEASGARRPRSAASDAEKLLPIRRSPADLPGRVADDFHWLGVYGERLEHLAVLARASVTRFDRFAAGAEGAPGQAILGICLARVAGQAPPSYGDAEAFRGFVLGLADKDGVFDGLIENVWSLTERLRDRLTGALYGIMSQSLDAVRSFRDSVGPATLAPDQLSHFAGLILAATATLAGLRSENMVQGGGRLFLELGLRFERAASVLATTVACVGREAEADREAGLALLLELSDSTITYRSRYVTVLQAAPVLDLVLADPGNPRGLVFQLTSLASLLGELEAAADGSAGDLAASAASFAARPASLVGALEAARVHDDATALVEPLIEIESALSALGRLLSRRYVDQLETPRRLGMDVEADAS